jgi:DNA-binding transcriptional LysR family regulator
MLNINHLRIFYHVAKNLSFTVAARELFVSQPAVTTQVKILEDTLKIKLFGKKRSKVYLTDEGKTLFRYAKRLLDFEHDIEAAIEDIKTLKQGVLRLATPTAFNSFVSLLMDKFYETYPKIKIQVIEGTSRAIVQKLIDNEAEVGIISMVEDHPDIEYIHLLSEEICFVVNPDHPLTHASRVSIQRLAKEPIITKASGSGTRKVVLDLFGKKGLTPNVILETSNTDSILAHVRRKNVGAFLIERDVFGDVREGKLVRIPLLDHQIILKIFIAFVKDHAVSLPTRAFFKILASLEPGTEYFPKLVPSWPDKCPYVDF